MRPSRPKMQPSHFPADLSGTIIFSAGPREAPKPGSRQPSVGTFIVQLVAGAGDHPRIDDAPAIAAENAAIAFPAGLSGTNYFFGGSSRGSKTPIMTTVHRDLSSSSLWQVPATIPASTMRPPSRRKMRPSHFRRAGLGPIILSAGPREASKPRSRPPSIGTFIVQLVAGPATIPQNRALTHTAGQASDRLLFRRVSTRTFHRSACGTQPLARGHRAGRRGGAGRGNRDPDT